MSLPNVRVLIQNGQLGGLLQFAEGITGIIGTGTAVSSKIQIGDPRTVFNLQDAIAIGITVADNPYMYRQVSEFYSISGNIGQELNIMIVADTMAQSDMVDNTNVNGAVKLLNFATGRIRLLITYFKAPGGYTLVTTNGIDDDVYDAITNAQVLAEAYAANITPLRVLLEGREFTGTTSALTDLNTLTKNRSAVLIGGTLNDKSCSTGLAMGMAASLPVQRKISRVQNGSLPINAAYVGTALVDTFSGIGAIHDKGFITIRKFPTQGGYFFSSDHMAAGATDDYYLLARGRVIDKAQVLTYGVYVQEVDNDVILIAGGKLDPGVIAYLQNKIEEEIKDSMVAKGECSDVIAFIDPNQDIITNNELNLSVTLLGVGYLGNITVNLGFGLLQ